MLIAVQSLQLAVDLSAAGRAVADLGGITRTGGNQHACCHAAAAVYNDIGGLNTCAV